MLDTAIDTDSLQADAPTTDLGPLAWVFEELRKSLDGANKAIKRFVRETEQSRNNDLEAVDPGSLRLARQQLHQAVGALEMVGLGAPAQVLRAMEAAVQRFVQRPNTCTEEAAGKVERASFALIEYLEAVLNNKPVQPVALFAQYRDVQELAAAERVHPADLWPFEHRGKDMAAAADATPLACNAAIRSLFDRLVLLVVKTQSAAAAQQLSKLCGGLSAGATDVRVRTFWRVSAAYFEAVAHRLLPPDVFVKRATSRILLQLVNLTQNKPQVSETLLHDLLFFCAQPAAVSASTTPHLAAVREAFGLGRLPPVDYHQATLGRYDPAVLAQARKRIHAAKEVWSLYAGGDASRSRQVADQFSLIGDSLLKLHPASTVLAQALVKAADQAVHEAGGVRAELAMEVATTTLYLEAAFEDFDPSAPELTERTLALAERLEGVLAGQPAQPLEAWMEHLYRRVSDRQTMGSVVGELKVSLGEVEKSLDQFFRAPQEKSGLHVAASQLAQMRGVLSVLGLDQAVHTVVRMRTTVEQILDTEVDEAMAREAGTFQQLGNNLSALSFLVDMLNYQPALAKKLFVFDDDKGELLPLMGRTLGASELDQPARAEAQAISDGVQRVVDGVQGGLSLVDLSEQLDSLADQASLAEQSGVARAAREAAEAVVKDDAVAGAQALMGLSESSVAGQPSAPEALSEDDAHDNDEDDLLDIFLEEAREVVANGLEAVSHLREHPGDLEHLTTLRRAFHTLKGSSRMVGLDEFGEAAWAMEQLLNTVLAEQRPASSELLALAGEAMTAFGRWVDDITARQESGWRSQPFRASAEALREQGVHLPLASPGAPHSVPVAAAAEVSLPDAIAPAESTDPQEAVAEPTFDLNLEAVSAAAAAAAAAPAALVNEAPVEDFAPTNALEQSSELGEPDHTPPSGEALLADIDFGSLAALSTSAQSAAGAALLPQATDALPVLETPHDGPDDVSPSHASTELVEPEVVQPEVADSEVKADDAQEEQAQEDQAQEDEAPASVALEVVQSVEPVDVPEVESLPDEQTKVIGPLRIGIKLYNVYLNEADEWSRRLSTVLAEWALERHEPVPEQAEALAHSLAGSSATVGFQPLSDIARALEHAIESVSRHQQAGQPATAEQAQLFVEASDDIRRLLHQFAAGFLKDPHPELMDALYRVVHDPQPELPDTSLDADAPAQEDAAAAAPELDPEPVPHAQPQADEAPVLALTGFEVPGRTEPAPSFTAPHADTSRVHQGAVQDIDDDIDAMDTVDVDLFPIFAEEAQELMPQLGGALRQWVARPDNASARAEVLRNLHTLKGSARLAGALRLGEMAHRMETSAERLGSDLQRGADLEPLQAAFDAISARFEQLRHADAEIVEIVQPAPEPAPLQAAPEVAAAVAPDAVASDTGGLTGITLPQAPTLLQARAGAAVRVRPELLDRLVNQTGEVMITRSRMESELVTLRGSLKDLTGNLDRLRGQLRDIELQAETQMQSRLAQARDADQSFDPLEFDRFTRVQELTRMMAESVNDVATVQRNLQRAVEATEDSLVAQARQTRELQRDLLRTRMVEFEGISERLYRVVRQASKETGKQVRLDITGGNIEMDRGVLDRMTGAFEHLLRNSVVHGIEAPQARQQAGKPAEGQIEIVLGHELNDVSLVFTDDGAGLDLVRLREKGVAQGLIEPGAQLSDEEAAQLVFEPGLSTAREVSELAGRGIGMDVVRSDVVALGGRIETATQAGQGSSFKLVLPLTTAVTQVVMLRAGSLTVGVPSNLVEVVRRLSDDELAKAYASGHLNVAGEEVPFYWSGALLQSSTHSSETQGRTKAVVIFRSAAQRVALHVDEVLGNQEVVVKNLGAQLSRLPGLAGMSVLASGAVALIYNPVALATVYGAQVPEWVAQQRAAAPQAGASGDALAPTAVEVNAVPLVLVVDDSITVRRVTQRLLQREGYRVTLAADGLQALEKLQAERPTVVLSDIEMPRMDGFDLVRNIRSDVRLSDLPVIMITSRIAEKHREHARELGVDHYLGKPYSEDELLALIGHYAKAAAEA
ncbi:MAG: Hpt domain-containing protein [Hydrogenophaga sp.]|jgi:chemosensory pili system protein ChpA (sensor histidine kinase/response regulator)|uniref:hybrid sensor histidine kinase/response regulator n=1 Tax=Hydrogenophaga sp. TaxID=1904254 RepID=UPI001DBD21B3|nr:Hpt domain-containing protein [Hydrogenophaga sp.]MBW0169237.1 Hpt domain-containing protein [Hydrogenophaga sp.]MBW0183549.1 Hpt domain-containing protein [Hydrogenophaga sp.]